MISAASFILSPKGKSTDLKNWAPKRDQAHKLKLGKTAPFQHTGIVGGQSPTSPMNARSAAALHGDFTQLPTAWLRSMASGSKKSQRTRPLASLASLATGASEGDWAKSVFDNLKEPVLPLPQHQGRHGRSMSMPALHNPPAHMLRERSETTVPVFQSQNGVQNEHQRQGRRHSIGTVDYLHKLEEAIAGVTAEEMNRNRPHTPARFLSKSSESSTQSTSKGPCVLADLAHKWSLPLTTVQESGAIFRRYAKCPNPATQSDLLKDGVLSEDILKKLVCELCGVESMLGLDPEAQRVMSFVDTNQDGSVDFHEFTDWYNDRAFLEYVNLSQEQRTLRAVAHSVGITPADMDYYKTLFDKFDVDASGEIDMEEFQELMHVLMKCPKGLRIPENRLKHFWHDADADGSGAVDLEEFVRFYLKHFDAGCDDPLNSYYRGIRPVHGHEVAD